MPLKENIEAVLNKFGKYVVQQARSNLSKKSKNVSKELYNSISYDLKVSETGASFSLVFKMAEYGEFQDKGVRGKSSSAKAPNSPYRFGSGKGKKGGLSDSIPKWVRDRRFQFRDRKTGKFMSYDSTAFLITRSIYQTGIRPSEFFSRPFGLAFKQLPPDIAKAFELTQEDLQEFTRRN
jgi:hypothetical protein